MELRQRQPREKAPKHLAFIRRLPCCVCVHTRGGGSSKDIHAAHIRYGDIERGKRPTGAGEKPDDKWTVPLCGYHHVWGGKDAQHSHGERLWWLDRYIDPLALAIQIWEHTGDEPACVEIINRL